MVESVVMEAATLSVTKTDVLAHARYVYRTLVARVIQNPQAERTYVRLLAQSWDDRLTDLLKVVSPVPVDDRVIEVLDQLTKAVSDAALTDDALLAWVDAFPDAISTLVGAAEDTGPDVDVETLESIEAAEASTGNRQPALALAA